MSDQSHLRLRKRLDEPVAAPVWPEGIAPAAFHTVNPRALHALLDETFPGSVARFDDWYGHLTSHPDFDPALCVPAMTRDGRLAGFVQCWKTGFIKDLAVAPAHRNKGLGAALMLHVFGLLAVSGVSDVALIVEPGEETARRLYARLGMVESGKNSLSTVVLKASNPKCR